MGNIVLRSYDNDQPMRFPNHHHHQQQHLLGAWTVGSFLQGLLDYDSLLYCTDIYFSHNEYALVRLSIRHNSTIMEVGIKEKVLST